MYMGILTQPYLTTINNINTMGMLQLHIIPAKLSSGHTVSSFNLKPL